MVLANSIVGLQEDISNIKGNIMTKLEELPEALKQTMLENFQIEGTVPITRHEMQEMMRSSIDDLKSTIETSIQSIAVRNQETVSPIVAGGIENRAQERHEYARFRWVNGSYHPVPEQFDLPV